MIKRIHSVLAAVIALSTTAWLPAAPASEASVKQLLEVTKVRGLVDNMFSQIDQMVKGAVAEASQVQTSSPKAKAAIETMQSKMMEVMKAELDWKVLEPLYVTVYTESLTQEEVDGMLAFYQTPVGQAVVTKLPGILQKSMTAMQARMGPMMQKMQKIQEEMFEELQREQNAEPTAADTPAPAPQR